jgi:hypothetical protein
MFVTARLAPDEDITPSNVHNTPLDIQGPITRALARQLNLEVRLFLSTSFYDFKNRLLPVAEPPELFRLKRASHRYTGYTNSNGTIHWSVGSPPDTTTVQQDRSRFTSHEGEFTIAQQLTHFNSQNIKYYYKPFQT